MRKDQLLIADLGWTKEEAFETRTRLLSFDEDWSVPGMEIYDAPREGEADEDRSGGD